MSINLTAGSLSASDFLSTLGVNTHSGFVMDGYANTALVIKSLNYLGIDTVRDAFSAQGAAKQALGALADAGIKFDFILSPQATTADVQTWVKNVGTFAKDNPGAVIAVEGLNEVDLNAVNFNGNTTLAGAAAAQRVLYGAVKANADLLDVPVINLSIGHEDASKYAAVGNLSQYADYGNSHAYTATGGSADAQQERLLALAANAVSGQKVFITETGYTTHETEDRLGVNATSQAKLTLTALFNAFENGSAQTFLYELFDSNQTTDKGDRERNFGLFESDGTPKLAAVALHNLTTVLGNASSGGSAVASGTQFTATGLPSDGHALTLAKGDGVYDIVLWRDVQVWDDVQNVERNTAAVQTKVEFGSVQQSVYVYDPINGSSPVAVYHNVSSVTLAVGDRPLIVEVGASGPVTEPAAATPAQVTMTAADFVAHLDQLADKPQLEKIILSDTHKLAVSTSETLKYIIANYGDVLAKVEGGYSFVVALTGPNWEKDQSFDASGKLVATTDIAFVSGVKQYEQTVGTDGSRSVSRYTAGKIIERVDVSVAGVRVTTSFDQATGFKLWTKSEAPDGSSISTNFTNNLATSISKVTATGERSVEVLGTGSARTVNSVSADGTKTALTYDADGKLANKQVTKADGSGEATAYNLTGLPYTQQQQYLDQSGKVTGVVRSRADGTLYSTENYGATGAKAFSSYDTAGKLASTTRIEANGAKLISTYNSAGVAISTLQIDVSGTKTTKLYDAATGALTHKTVVNVNGTGESFAYKLTGLAYTQQHQYFDATGKVTAVVRERADGTLYSTENYAASGAKALATYDTAGKLATSTRIEADGTKQVFTYNAAGAKLSSLITDLAGTTVSKSFDPTSGALTKHAVSGSTDSTLIGGSGEQTLIGGSGNDLIDGGAGNDVLSGGAGADTVSYASATAGVTVNLGLGRQDTTGAGIDTISGFENLTGSDFDDVLFGNAGDNVIMGGAGNDRIIGGGGADTLFGGAGADTFLLQTMAQSTNEARDAIRDFNRAEGDIIDLSQIDAIAGTANNDKFTFVETGAFTGKAGQLIAVAESPNHFLVQGDVNGDGKADFSFWVDSPAPLNAGSFML